MGKVHSPLTAAFDDPQLRAAEIEGNPNLSRPCATKSAQSPLRRGAPFYAGVRATINRTGRAAAGGRIARARRRGAPFGRQAYGRSARLNGRPRLDSLPSRRVAEPKRRVRHLRGELAGARCVMDPTGDRPNDGRGNGSERPAATPA
jgi:hypothetical protein